MIARANMIGKLFQHIKSGSIYRLINIGYNEENQEPLAIYQFVLHQGDEMEYAFCKANSAPSGKSTLWVRPLQEFREKFTQVFTPRITE